MRKTSIHWILLAVLAQAPAAALAQLAPPPSTAAARGQTEKAQAKTAEANQEEMSGAREAQGRQAEAVRDASPTRSTSAIAHSLNEGGSHQQSEEAQPEKDDDPKLTPVPGGKALGMSILGNQEAPKALVIVPWKSSELGNGPSVSTMLDDSRLPIDKEVFMRMLSYYEIRSETARPSAATTNGNAAAPANAPQRRKP